MNWRMLGSAKPQFQTMQAYGRTYSAAEGQPLDVPSGDAGILQANSWVYVAPSGPSTGRPSGDIGPTPAIVGTFFVDTTLNSVIVFDGKVWRDPISGAAV